MNRSNRYNKRYLGKDYIVSNDTWITHLNNDLESAHFIGTRVNKSQETVLCMDREYEYILESGKLGKLVRKIPSYGFTLEDESDFEMGA